MTISSESLERRDPAAWDEFYRQHLREVYGFVFRLVQGDQPVAEDLFQEIWLQALDGIGQFDPRRGELRGWLFGIARRRVAFYWRQQMRRKGLPGGERTADGTEEVDGAILPDRAVEQLEEESVVQASLLMLHPDCRRVLTAKYVEGLSVEQIASRIGKSSKAVESLLSRSRSKLRSLLNWYFTHPTEGKQT